MHAKKLCGTTALKLQRSPSRVHPAAAALSPSDGRHLENNEPENRNTESSSNSTSKGMLAFCGGRRSKYQTILDEESQDAPDKYKGCWRQLRRKSGGIIITLHQLFCLALFLGFESRVYLESNKFPELIIPLLPTLLVVINVILMLTCIAMDPGVQPKKSESHQKSESLYYNSHRKGPAPVIRPMVYYGRQILGNYCFTCRHFKHPRTYHCDHCDRCIIRYDHHCTIFDCCIGIRNFAVYFYLILLICVFHLYITCFSVKVFVELVSREEYREIVDRVAVLWISLISIVISLICDTCHLTLFPCVYLFVTAHGKTARELFFVVHTQGHHCKCYKVIKSIQGFREAAGGSKLNFSRMLKNFRTYLCSPIPPSLLKEENYYVVCDLDEVDWPLKKGDKLITGDFDTCSNSSTVRITRSKSEGDLVYVYKQELAYKLAETRKISCCAL